MAGQRGPIPKSSRPAVAGNLAAFEVLVAVCGGIAAYKTASLVSRLIQRGAGVTVAMTAAAQRFVAPLTFQTLTGRRVLTDLWDSSAYYDPQHLVPTEQAHLLVIAPATANTIAKIAHGLADDLVSTMVLAAASPVLLAPSMNTRMWENPIVQQNLRSLSARGYHVVSPGEGWLACRAVGQGRMAEPEDILAAIEKLLTSRPPKRRT